MTKSHIKTVTGLVVTGAVGFYLYFLFNPHPDFELRPHEQLGRVVAEEALKLLGNDGRIIVFARDPASFDMPAIEAQWNAFCRRIAESKVKIASTNLLKLDPLRPTSVPPAAVFDRLARAKSGDVLVSFTGPAELSEDQLRKLGNKVIPIVAICSGDLPKRVNLRKLFEQQLLRTAIISRPIPKSVPNSNSSAQSWFDAFFQIVTTNNLDDLPRPRKEQQ